MKIYLLIIEINMNTIKAMYWTVDYINEDVDDRYSCERYHKSSVHNMKIQINETVYSNKYKNSSKFNVQEANHLAISNQQNDQLHVGLCGAVPVSQDHGFDSGLWTK